MKDCKCCCQLLWALPWSRIWRTRRIMGTNIHPSTTPECPFIVSSFCVSIWSAYIPLIPHPEFFTSSWFNPPKMTGATPLLVSAKRTSKTNNNPNPQGAHLHQKLPKLCQVDYMEFCQHLSTFNKRDPMMIQSMIKYSVMELSGLAFWRGVYRGWWLLQKSGGLNQLSW